MVSAIKELLPTNLAAAAALFVALRIVHRLYYVLAGHEHYWLLSPYRPSEAFESFLKARVKAVTEHSFAAKKVRGPSDYLTTRIHAFIPSYLPT